ncbi:MAG: hypothetical protein R3E79_03895 [Caldilineaceae bacterium]
MFRIRQFRALRGDPRITSDTTDRILQLADELGYIPNSIAQSLNTQRTNTIGLLVTSVADPVVMDFMEGAEEVAQERGYCIFLSTRAMIRRVNSMWSKCFNAVVLMV